MRRAVAVLALIALGLTGCSAGGVVAFDRAQTEADVPDIDFAAWGIERDSSRLLAEEAGVRYYVARADRDMLCIVHVSPDSEPAATCGTEGLALQWADGPNIELVVPDMGDRPGWRKLASNLYAENG